MSMEKYNKEQIRNRMLKYAAAFWGIKKAENFDPVVKLMLEALSNDTRADLEHALIARKLGKLANALNHMVVDQEVLAQAMLGRKAKLLQQLPCCRGVCQRRSCHSCLLSMVAASRSKRAWTVAAMPLHLNSKLPIWRAAS